MTALANDNKGVRGWVKSRANKLRGDSSAIALTEFAFTAPIVLGLGMLGTETAYYVITHMKISQVAMQVADNASRVGTTDVLVSRKVYEDDVNQTFVGAEKLGDNFDIYEKGRIILSSLEQNDRGGQWIHWQRCRGAKRFNSSYGTEGTGRWNNNFRGMGEDDNRITASEGSAVMFVEISYTYEALTPFDFLDGEEIRYTAAFNIRDSRDLTELYPSQTGQGTASCNVYSADRP